MEAALRAIAQPRRREILRLVRNAELPASEIASHFEVTRPAISQHLRAFKAAGLVEERRRGTQRLYRAKSESLEELRRFLEDFWDQSLDRLKEAAERDERRSDRSTRTSTEGG